MELEKSEEKMGLKYYCWVILVMIFTIFLLIVAWASRNISVNTASPRTDSSIYLVPYGAKIEINKTMAPNKVKKFNENEQLSKGTFDSSISETESESDPGDWSDGDDVNGNFQFFTEYFVPHDINSVNQTDGYIQQGTFQRIPLDLPEEQPPGVYFVPPVTFYPQNSVNPQQEVFNQQPGPFYPQNIHFDKQSLPFNPENVLFNQGPIIPQNIPYSQQGGVINQEVPSNPINVEIIPANEQPSAVNNEMNKITTTTTTERITTAEHFIPRHSVLYTIKT